MTALECGLDWSAEAVTLLLELLPFLDSNRMLEILKLHGIQQLSTLLWPVLQLSSANNFVHFSKTLLNLSLFVGLSLHTTNCIF